MRRMQNLQPTKNSKTFSWLVASQEIYAKHAD